MAQVPNTTVLANIIKHGLSIQHLHNFIESQPEHTLQNVSKETRKLLTTDNENARSDLFFDIYEKIHANLPACTVADVLFFSELISILELLMCQLPSPPSQILRVLFGAIPDELQTREFLNSVTQKVFSISSDIGDKTHLCKFFARLGPKWDPLKGLLSWITLKHILGAESTLADTPTIPGLHNLISKYGPPKTIRGLAMAIRLIGLLIHRLALKETGENAEVSSKWLKRWLKKLPSEFNTLFVTNGPLILDAIKLQALITDITTGWPDVPSGN